MRQSTGKLTKWFIEDALPLWAAQSYDHERGGFYETLNFDGEPITGQPRRVRVQARQIYLFAHAGVLGWHDGAEELSAKGFDYFLAHACPDDGDRGCVHLLSDDGIILDEQRDLYDQAFLILAAAWRWRAARDQRALTLLDKTVAFLDRELSSPDGGWFENDSGALPRRQNPHMHLFEAFMAAYEATGGDQFLSLARKVYKLFTTSFYDGETGVLREFFDARMKPAKGADGQRIEPGHMMEWVWLLNRYSTHTGEDTRSISKTLYDNAKKYGANAGGYLIDSVVLGEAATNDMRRLWPQTEYIKAALSMAQDGDKTAREDAAAAINRLFDSYLNQKTRGLWCDQYDGAGEPVATDVPASILYHLFEAVADAADDSEEGNLSP